MSIGIWRVCSTIYEGRMSFSSIIDPNLRVEGNIVVYPKVQLHQLTNAILNLEEEYLNSWSMVLYIEE
jgi:hypothetical protein